MIPGESNKSLMVNLLKRFVEILIITYKKILRFRRVRSLDHLYLSFTNHPNVYNAVLDVKKHKEIDDFYSKYIKIRHNSHIETN